MPPRTPTMPQRQFGESVERYAKRVRAWQCDDDIPNVQPDLARFKTATMHLNREKD